MKIIWAPTTGQQDGRLDGLWVQQKVEGYPHEETVRRMEGVQQRPPPVCPIGPFRQAVALRLRQLTWACSRSWDWVMVAASSSALSYAPLLPSLLATAPPFCPSPLQRCCRRCCCCSVWREEQRGGGTLVSVGRKIAM